MRTKKSLGQNFLTNVGAARRIVSLLQLQPGDSVMEIGAGRGDLTVHLVESNADILAVELDKDLVKTLRERFSQYNNFHLVEADILTVDPGQVGHSSEFKLVGNIPYNISSAIIEWAIKQRRYFPEVVLTVQKEVGERIIAGKGNKQYGSLSVFVQLFYSAKKIFILKPGSFFPKPKVSSVVIHLQRLEQALITDSEYPDLRRLTRACFRWRRKQMLSILREEYGISKETAAQILADLSIMIATRPEQLSVAQFVTLTKKLRCQEPDSP